MPLIILAVILLLAFYFSRNKCTKGLQFELEFGIM